MPPTYVHGLTRPVSVSEYATLTGVSEAEVRTAIRALKIQFEYSKGEWWVEAPPNSEARLAQLRSANAEPKQESGLTDWVRELAAEARERTQSDSQPQRPRLPPFKSQPAPINEEKHQSASERADLREHMQAESEAQLRAPASLMVPDHDCVPDVDRAVTISEYATLEGLREADVLAVVGQLKIPATYFRGQWFIEAPRNCKARLARLRGELPKPRKAKANIISALDQTKVKAAIWYGGCILSLLIGIGSCSSSSAISNGLVHSYRTCADGWPSHSIGIQGACSHHGGVVTREVDNRSDTQRYACYALNAVGIIGLLAALSLWANRDSLQSSATSCVARGPQSHVATPPAGTPLCPRCSQYMIRRQARRGRRAGQFFWSCSAYPSCRGTRPLR